MRRLMLAGAVIACGIGGAYASGVFQAPEPGWREIAWPFPRDAWPAGRAFRCGSPACGGDVEIYLRAKLGFCSNCATGVTGDAEVDGVADLDMISDDFVPAASGQSVVVGPMRGRSRRYTQVLADGRRTPSAGFAMARQCDLFVVAAQGAGVPGGQAAIIAFLETPAMAHWINAVLDGG